MVSIPVNVPPVISPDVLPAVVASIVLVLDHVPPTGSEVSVCATPVQKLGAGEVPLIGEGGAFRLTAVDVE